MANVYPHHLTNLKMRSQNSLRHICTCFSGSAITMTNGICKPIYGNQISPHQLMRMELVRWPEVKPCCGLIKASIAIKWKQQIPLGKTSLSSHHASLFFRATLQTQTLYYSTIFCTQQGAFTYLLSSGAPVAFKTWCGHQYMQGGHNLSFWLR